jgi:hypothetical protein
MAEGVPDTDLFGEKGLKSIDGFLSQTNTNPSGERDELLLPVDRPEHLKAVAALDAVLGQPDLVRGVRGGRDPTRPARCSSWRRVRRVKWSSRRANIPSSDQPGSILASTVWKSRQSWTRHRSSSSPVSSVAGVLGGRTVHHGTGKADMLKLVFYMCDVPCYARGLKIVLLRAVTSPLRNCCCF